MDRQSVYTLSLFGENDSLQGAESNRKIRNELVDFILEFHLENVYIYRYEEPEWCGYWISDKPLETK